MRDDGFLDHLNSEPRRVYSMWRGWIVVPCAPRAAMCDIVAEASRRRRIPVEAIMGRSTLREIAHARHEAMWVCWNVFLSDGRRRWSLPRIGRFFGRDHTTVLFGVRAHERRAALQ